MSNEKHTEKANAQSVAGADISRNVAVVEAAKAEGYFDVQCIGPREACRDEYIRLRDELIARRNKITNKLKRIFFGDPDYDDEACRQIVGRMRGMEEVKWQDVAANTVTTVGKNLALDTYLAGSSYSVTGPYMGLISSTSWSATAAGDTMSSHGGWLEAGNANTPTYTSPRKTAAWSSASSGSKALSSALSFAMTGAGTVKGCFLVYGTGAVSTIDNTSGTLYSAGVFTGGDKTVANGDTLNVSYTASL